MSLAASISTRVFTFTRFPLDVPLKWDAPTSSSTMRDLVDRREDIFTKQRQAGDEPLRQGCGRQPRDSTSSRPRRSRRVQALLHPRRHPSLSSERRHHRPRLLREVLGPGRPEPDFQAAPRAGHEGDGERLDGTHGLRRALRRGPGGCRPRGVREGAAEEEDQGTAQSPRPPKRARPSYIGQDRPYESCAGDASAGDADESEYDDPSSLPQLSTPGMPQPGDQFSSSKSAEQAVARALVPVYGYSTRARYSSSTYHKIFCIRNHGHYATSAEGVCEFSIVVKKSSASGRWVVDGDESSYEHAHGPHPRLVADPSWRPTIHRAVVREALGMPPASAGGGSRKRKVAEMLSSSSENDDEDPETDERVGELPEKLGAARWEVEDGRAGTSSETQPHVTYGRDSEPEPRRPSSPPPPPPPPPALSTSNAVSPRSAFALDHATVSPTYDLVAILHALKPSLASLAPHLAAAGINSVDAVVALISLEPATLDLLFDDLRLVVHPADRSRPSIVQLKLLKKLFEEERAVRRGDRGV